MNPREEEARTRSASTPALPPAWVFSPIPNGHVYEDAASQQGLPYASAIDAYDILRPKSVPPEGELASAPPAPPPLPAPTSIKERRKFSRKYGSGVYSESPQQIKGYGPLSDAQPARNSVSVLRQSDPYITPSLSPTLQSPYAQNENGTLNFSLTRPPSTLYRSFCLSGAALAPPRRIFQRSPTLIC